jgi:predicted nucleotidyltransferase
MKFGLTDETITKINSVFRNHPEIDSVLIYGSRAMGNYREGSDIDITLIGEEITHTLLSLVMQEI